MPRVIRVRDVARNIVHELGPEQPILRVPYELFQAAGAMSVHDGLVDWKHGEVAHTGRVAPATLGDAHPGERLLLRLPPLGSEDEWWLYEVEAVDGVAAAE